MFPNQPDTLQALVSQLSEMDGAQLAPALDEFSKEWSRPRGDLCAWVPLLNRFDDMLEEMVQKYGLSVPVPPPMPIEPADEKLLISILRFSAFLLQKCSNRGAYASADRVSNLIKCTSPFVLEAALRVCVELAQRFAQSRLGRPNVTTIDPEMIFKMVRLIPDIKESSIKEEAGITTCTDLRDYIESPKGKYPSSLDFQFYVTKKLHSGMQTYHLDESELSESSLTDLHQAIHKNVPEDVYFDALYRMWGAKSIAMGPSGVELRQTLTKIQLLALGFASCSLSEETLEARIMDQRPNLVKQVGGLAFPQGMPSSVRILALDTLSYVCHQQTRRADVLSAVSGNVSHGALMSSIRHMITALQTGEDIDEDFSSALFATIIHIAASHGLCMILVSAGLVPLLLELVQVRNDTKCVRTLSAVMELLDHVIIDVPATFPVFTQARGVSIMIEAISREVDYDIAHKDEERSSVPDYCFVDHRMSYFRSQWIRSLFVVVSNILTHIRGSENVHNVVDSPLMHVTKLVVLHSSLFGSKIVSLNLQIVSAMLENEAALAFGIMHESKVIDTLLDTFPSLLSQSSHSYYSPVLRVLGAFAQSEGGLQLLKDKKLLEWYFEQLAASDLTQHDNVHFLGGLFESISVEHAELRPVIASGCLKLLRVAGGRLDDMPDAFYNESELPPSSVELIGPYGDMPAKLTTMRSLIRFLDGLLKSHLIQAEFIRQGGAEELFLLVERDGIPYDLVFGQLGATLGRVLRLLFSLDIDTKSFQDTILSHTSKWLDQVEQHFHHSDILRTDSGDEYLRTLAKLGFVVQLFYQIVFFDYGTGYRLLLFLQRIVEQDEGRDTISRLLNVQRQVILQDARTQSGLSDKFLLASQPVTEENYKETKTAQLELEDAKSSFFYQVKVERFLCAAFVDSSCKVCSELGSVTNSERALNEENKKNAFKMADILGSSMALHVSFCNKISAVAANVTSRIAPVIKRIMFKRTSSSTSAYLIVYALFRQRGGLGSLSDLACHYIQQENRSDADSQALNELLVLLKCFLSPKTVVENNRFVQATTCHKTVGYFYPNQFLVECQLLVFSCLFATKSLYSMKEMNEGQLHNFLYLIQLLWDPAFDLHLSEQSAKYRPMPFLSWRKVCPSESKVQSLVNAGVEEAEARKVLLQNHDDLKKSAQSLDIQEDQVSEDSIDAIEEEPVGKVYGVLDGKNLVEQADFNLLRSGDMSYLLSAILEVIVAHPQTIFLGSSVLQAIVRRSGLNEPSDSSQLLANEILNSIRKSEFAEKSAAATLTHLLGILMQNYDWLYEVLPIIWPNMALFIDPLRSNPNAAAESWYPALMFVIERLITIVDIPKAVKSSHEGQFDLNRPPMVMDLSLDQSTRDEIFDHLAKAVTISADVASTLATARLLVHFSKNSDYASKLVFDDVLENLLTRTSEACKAGKQQTVTKLHTAVILVVRQTIESAECIRRIMRAEIQKYFDSTRSADVVHFLKSHYAMICRNADIFMSVAAEQLACTDHGLVLVLKSVLNKRLQRMTTELGSDAESLDLQALDVEGEKDREEASIEPTSATHRVVQLLMTQILSLKVFDSLDDDFKREKNADYIHCCFVLQCLAEIATYNDCKLALVEKGHRKRSPFGYLLQEVLPVGTLSNSMSAVNQQRNTVAGMAMGVLENVLWCGAEDQELPAQPDRPISNALQTVRKIGIELIARTLRDVFNSHEPIEKRYVLLGTLCELSYRIIAKHRGVEYNPEDGALLARMMYDRKFAPLVTTSLGEMDVNFPGIKKVVKSGVKFLTKMSLLTVDDSSKQPTVSDDDDEDDGIASALESDLDSEYEDRETPDLFRNSTLGMYEVEDDEEEDIDETAEMPEESDMMDYDEVNDEVQSDVDNSDEEPYDEVELVVHDHMDIDSEDESDIESDVEVVDENDDESSDSWESYEESENEDNEAVSVLQSASGSRRADGQLDALDDEDMVSYLPPDSLQIYDEPIDHFSSESGTETDSIDEDDEDGEAAGDLDMDYFEINRSFPRGRDFRMDRSGGAQGETVSNPMADSNAQNQPAEFPRRRRSMVSTIFNQFASIFGGEQGEPAVVEDEVDGLLPPPRSTPPRLRDGENALSVISHLQGTKDVTGRWQEAALMFGVFQRVEVTRRLANFINNSETDWSKTMLEKIDQASKLISQKKEKEKQEREEREKADKLKAEEELAEKERVQQEEKEKKKKEDDEAKARQEEEANAQQPESSSSNVVDGVTSGQSSNAQESSGSTMPAASDENQLVNINGHLINVQGLGIDPMILAELPEEFRQEALTQHLREMHREGQEVPDLDPVFLEALPESVRSELHLPATRPAETSDTAGTSDDAPADVNNAEELVNLLATLDRSLRDTVLAEQAPETIALLPPELAEEARRLQRSRFGIAFAEGDDMGMPDEEEFDGDEDIDFASDGGGVSALQGGLTNALTELANALTQGVGGMPDVTGRQGHRHHHHGTLRFRTDLDRGIARRRRGGSNLEEGFEQDGSRRVASAAKYDLIDKAGIASLVRLLYIPQSIRQRSLLHELLHYLCSNKACRVEMLNLILHILQDGCGDRQQMEKGFAQLCTRSRPKKINNSETSSLSSPAGSVLPPDILPHMLVQQILECLEYLVSCSGNVKYFFLTEHEAVEKRRRNRGRDKDVKYPINVVIGLLKQPAILESNVALELVTAVLQEISKALSIVLKENPEKLENFYLPEKNLRRVCAVLTVKECSSRTFQQTIAVMHNLCAINGIKDVFGAQLVEQAMSVVPLVTHELNELVKVIEGIEKDSDLQGSSLGRFSSGESTQTKLLRVLTAIDYLFNESTSSDVEPGAYLKSLYQKMSFGPLWGALSSCLTLIQDRQNLIHVATALLPLIESLMVVCKISKMQLKEPSSNKYEAKKYDIANEPLESLFFSFTDDHRKILNQMVRNNPKLMSGSFAILVKNPKALEFDNKRRYFYRHMYDTHHSGTISVNVRRENVFLDSYKSLYFKSADEIKTSRLNIKFQGEEGVDAGGVTREWYQVLSRQMFNPDYALFSPVAADSTTFHPNRTSWVNPEHLSFFKFVGRIVGKAIYDQKVLDCHFSRAVYKRLLGKQVSMRDMETLDLDYYKSLLWMLENDITDIITETFSIETDDYGEQKVIDLVPNGHEIPVTEANKQEYVQCVVDYRLVKSVQEQLNSFLEGFHDIISEEAVAIFDEQELELLISGLPDIDIDDWRNNSEYHNYSSGSAQIKWFWRAVRSFDAEERAKLLQFVTGTSKVPLNGFAKLEGMNGIAKFNIHRNYGSKDRLPSSHTCFNQLDLPEYESYETLRGALLTAITEGREGFGFV